MPAAGDLPDDKTTGFDKDRLINSVTGTFNSAKGSSNSATRGGGILMDAQAVLVAGAPDTFSRGTTAAFVQDTHDTKPGVPGSSVVKATLAANRRNGVSVVTSARTGSLLRRTVFLGGLGMNLPGEVIAPGSLQWNDFNVHPSITVIIPLNGKLSLHTGIRAFSTLHQKGVSIRERELNNTTASGNYSVTTTSVIKASYFDLPLSVHYAISPQWHFGAGIQLSRFYKLRIREENENYDLNNSIVSATTMQYSASAGQLAASPSLHEKVTLKKTEARLMAEVSLLRSRWLFSAGYYYSTGKNIELKDAGGDYLYRNEYVKFSVEYQLWKNRPIR